MRSIIRMSNIAFATLLLGFLVFASQSVQAAPTVINTADAGAGSLRQAILDAITASAATTIDFNIPTSDPGYNSGTVRFTITLLTALPNLPLAPLTINNTMGKGVTVTTNNGFRILTLVNSAVVVINNLTISHGNTGSGVGDFAKGGGIFMGNSATLTLNNCIVSDSTATNGGGGIWINNSGVLFLNDTTISNNTVTGGDGGGIRMFDSTTLNITRTTVSGNHAPVGGGGGIYNGVSGTVTATNITVSGNTAGTRGGGINNSETPATATVNSSTISGNTATVGGGGIFNGPTSTATLNNSLVALNTGASTPDLLGAFTANSCLIGNADGSTVSGANNQLGTTAVPINPLLGPLQNNGGPPLTPFTPTFTLALLAGSPAIDTGATALPTDQRGVSRPQDGDGVGGAQPDIGSFEKRLVEPTSGGAVQFSASSYSVLEGDPQQANLTVTRSGDTTGAATVRYATSDTAGLQSCSVVNGKASERCDYETTVGTLRFAAGETSKSFIILIINDVYVEGSETFTVTLSAPTGANLGSPSTATVTILDNDFGPAANPIDGVDFFVTLQYMDFLGRLPDTLGFANWVATLGPCPNGGFGEFANPGCDRVHVSAGFYQSDEFQDRGYFAYRFYEVGLGRRPLYKEFIPDMTLVGGAQSPAEEALSKATYIDEFVLRTEFITKYPGLSGQPLANALWTTAGLSGSPITVTGSMTNGQILRAVVETSAAFNKFFNRGFVSMQYFGYLRRDPDTIGFTNWVTTLDADSSNFRHMIFGFIYSDEYRHRFGP